MQNIFSQEELMQNGMQEIERQLPPNLGYGEVQDCPHCGRIMQVYKHGLRPKAIHVLANLWEQHKWEKVRAREISHYDGTGEFAKTRWFGLTKQIDRNYWRITEHGVRFLRGQAESPEYVWLFDDQRVPDDPLIDNAPKTARQIAPKVMDEHIAIEQSLPIDTYNQRDFGF
jgi:hypothetical protein